MTEEEYHSLDPHHEYRFKLYYAEDKVGYIAQDFDSNEFYIVRNTQDNRNKPVREKGFKINLSQIEKWEVLVPNPVSNVGSFTIYNSPKAKKMIILGAGASYGYSYDDKLPNESKPPLTNNLFSDHHINLLQKYEGAFHLSNEINLASDLESYFEKQWKKVSETHNQPLLNRLINSQYYIHELLFNKSIEHADKGKNNYVSLVMQANDYSKRTGEFVPIVTFNYDTLIESALNKNDSSYTFHSIESYIDYQSRKLLLFKPHGSSNWGRKFNPQFAPTTFVQQSVSSIDLLAKHILLQNKSLSTIYDHLEKDIVIIQKNNNEKVKQNLYYNYYYPWILIPYKSKDEMIMPAEHSSLLKYFLPNIEEILIIGWKGSEANFQSMLKNKIGNKPVKITLIEPSEKIAESFISEYSKILPNASINHLKHGTANGSDFSSYIRHSIDNDVHFFS
jgi:hypothetical protein